MKAVTAAFKAAQNQASPIVVREVYYKRRYWSPTLVKFIWEAAWTRIMESDVQSVSAITWQLDSERLSEFRVSNVTISLRNDENQWLWTNPSGIFGGDATSRIGYEANWTKFQIKAGFELADGTAETVAIFTGLSTEPVADSDSGFIKINIQGLEALLINANAENVSQAVASETLTGTVNSVNKDFTASQNGVGIMQFVSDNGLNRSQGVDYDVSQLNEKTLPAKVSFAAAPITGHTMRTGYKYWYQNTAVKTLIQALLTEAGIASGDQEVEDVVLASVAGESFLIDTQANWGTGTFASLEATTSPGDLTFDYSDAAFRSLLNNFSSSLGDFSGAVIPQASVALASGQMRLTYAQDTSIPGTIKTFYPVAARNSICAAGIFEAKMTRTIASAERIEWAFMAQTITTRFTVVQGGSRFETTSMKVLNGYSIAVDDVQLFLFRYNAAGALTVLSQVSIDPGTSQHTYKVIRNPINGRIDVFYDGTLKMTVFDTTFNSSAAMGFSVNGNADIDDVYTPPATVTGTYESASLDATAGIQAWGILNPAHVLPSGGSVTYQSKTSTDNVSFEAYLDATPGYRLDSGVKRYLKLKVFMTAPTDGTISKVVNIIQGYYIASTFTQTTLANYTDQTVYDAITNYSRFSDYEFGFTPDEKFFFRSRRTGHDPLIDLTDSANVLKIVSEVPGWDRVFSEIQATYGNYDVLLKADQVSPMSPKLRFGSRRLSVDGADILIDDDVNVAAGIATDLLNRYSRPKRRFKLQTIILPQLDLSDVVRLTYADVKSPQTWFLGDTAVFQGQTDIYHYGDQQQLAKNLISKVTGVRFDTETWTCELDLEEIL